MSRRTLPPLTSDLIQEIMYGMQNQKDECLFYPDVAAVVSRDSEKMEQSDPGEGISLPAWSSKDGFALMVKFLPHCPNRNITAKLKNILDSHQKGVFKAFREVLEADEESLRKWYDFRDSEMGKVIRHWYFELSLPVECDDDSDVKELSLSDFSISKDCGSYEAEILKITGPLSSCDAFVCLGPFDAPAGFICYSKDSRGGWVIPAYYVNPEYRRIGVFDLLFQSLLNEISSASSKQMKVQFPIYAGYEFIANKLVGFRPDAISTTYSFSLS
jgi:hypothetical protein